MQIKYVKSGEINVLCTNLKHKRIKTRGPEKSCCCIFPLGFDFARELDRINRFDRTRTLLLILYRGDGDKVRRKGVNKAE